MTWRTPDGDRTLEGAEAELVREALGRMVDRISKDVADDRSGWGFGVDLFDELTSTQQLAVIHHLATHLLTATKSTPDLTAVNEAAVYAVFQTLTTEIENEIDTEDQQAEGLGLEACYWRTRALQAYQESFPDDDDLDDFEIDDPSSSWLPPCDERSRNQEHWQTVTESMADRILWDRDFEMAGDFLDTDPQRSGMMKQLLGVDDDYFSDVAVDVSPSSIDELLAAVRRITHRKPR